LVWKKKQGGGNDSTHFVIEHEYVFCFAKQKDSLIINLDVTHELDNALYPFFDEKGTEYGLVTLDKSSIRFSDSLVFEIKDKDGNSYLPRIVKGKQSCWRWGQKKVIEEYEKLVFKNGKVYTKYYRPEGVVPKSILYDTRFGRTESGKDAIKDVLGNSLFSYPKPLELIRHIIRLGSHKCAIILDFFAGSGTTLHSTMQLNAEDGGNRQCILVTNNENNIAEEVCYERNRRVIQGYTNSKGDWVPGLTNNNLRYYKSEFVGREPSLKNKRELTKLATELLCIKEDCYQCLNPDLEGLKEGQDEKIDFKRVKKALKNDMRLFSEKGKNLLVIYNEEVIEEAVALIKYLLKNKSWKSENQVNHGSDVFKVYVFANGQYAYAEEFEDIAANITLAALPDAIYKAYQNVLPKVNREFIPVLEEETFVEPQTNLNL
jgi:adenine-specific DNA-methyltransferase